MGLIKSQILFIWAIWWAGKCVTEGCRKSWCDPCSRYARSGLCPGRYPRTEITTRTSFPWAVPQLTHPLLCHTDPAFPLPFSCKEVISQAIISLPTKNILVTENQGVKKKYDPFLKPQSFWIAAFQAQKSITMQSTSKNIIPVIAKQIVPSRLIKKVSGR